MSLPLRDKPHLMQKLERTFNGALYRDAIKTSSNYNTRLINERAIRLPFIDLQTGVAQNNCSLWMRRWERMPGYNQGQIYSYPNRRWRKVKRTYLLNNLYSSKVSLESNVDEKSEVIGESSEFGIDSCLIDIPIKTENVDSSEKSEVSKEPSSRDPEEMLPDVLDFGEVDDPDTEEDEDYVSEIKRKTRKKHSKRKKASEYTDAEKPFVCDLCGIKYKTRPGLSYHYAHTHAFVNGDGGLSDDVKIKDEGIAKPNNYCDFCLGNDKENKKTGHAEKLISCTDCGRSAHQSCLKFTPNMAKSVKTYKWQCIECKSCNLCGSSEFDDQLLVCDDCDRGYHLFCLDPPLVKPPEGLWSCDLCIKEYYIQK